ncbi:ABC transporter substrate-binding protein [Haloprofundus halophilus]|uniref:ABC transporter substrate-binding protein n=1 Tax=Haloprofundus halophilus TaxID=2283527 RepID=UPI000E449B14|nr:ABC transporter substrate-binding protein [Haloprofundus halophilus]
MTEDRQSRVSRRRYLQLAGGAAATAALAGCSGDSDEINTETPADTGGDGGGNDTGNDTGSSDGEDNQDGGEFAVTITQGQMDSGLDPHDHRETTTDIITMQMYEGALDRNREGQVIEGLAENYEQAEPDRVRLTLREGVTFHNGDELTPADVAFSINRIVNPDVGNLASPQSDQLAGITEAQPVEGENAVDVVSDGVNPMAVGLLASYGDIMQQSWVESNDNSYINSHANGTGPFQLSNYTQDESVEYTKYEEYWREPAAVDALTITSASESSTRVNQLVSGETDIVVNVPPQEVSRINGNDNTSVEAVPSTRVIYNGMRYDVEPFSNRDFRRAMNLAIDLDTIVAEVLADFSDPTGQPTLEGFVGYNPDIDPYPYDVEQAEQLVEESGFAGATLELHTPVGRYLKDLEIAQAVVGYINELSNVEAEVTQRDFGDLAAQLTTGNIEDMPDWYLIGWGNETFDASQTLIPLLSTDGALSSWSNEEFDSLLDEAGQTADADQREQLLREANQLAHDEAPWIFLNRQYSVYGASSRIDWQPRRDESIKAYEIAQP